MFMKANSFCKIIASIGLILCFVSSPKTWAQGVFEDDTKFDYTVSPLLGFDMKWHQGYPYSNLCPVRNGKNCPVGCAALAMGMVMKHHGHPQAGSGSVSYYWKGEELKVTLGHTYNWDLIKKEYRYYTTESGTPGEKFFSEEEASQVSTLLRDIGYTLSMNYDEAYGSGSSEENIAKALVEYFDYDSSVSHLCLDYVPLAYWEEILKEELDNNRPVCYGGGSEGGAHEFVCDGYTKDGKFHFNYGNYIERYTCSIADIPSYTSGNNIVFNIKPNASGKPSIIVGCNKDFLHTEANTITANIRFFNPIKSFAVEYAIAVENTANGNKQYVSNGELSTSCEVGNPSYLKSFSIDEVIEEGDYKLYPVWKIKGDDTWQNVLFGDNKQSEVSLSVKGGEKTFSNNNLREDIDRGTIKIGDVYYKLEGDNAIVTYANSNYNSYKDDIVIPSTVPHNGKDYIVNKIGEKAFNICERLNSVRIGKNVESIDYGAFYDASVKSIEFEKGSKLESIGSYSFAASDIERVSIPEGCKVIWNNAFQQCYKLKNLSIPASINTIYNGAFNLCDELDSIVVYRAEPLALTEDATPFENIREAKIAAIKLIVPRGSGDAYRSSAVWKKFNIIEADLSVEEGGDEGDGGDEEGGNEEGGNDPIVSSEDSLVGSENGDGEIYDLLGRKVCKYELKKNTIYIKNGKKFVVKE